MLDIEDELHIAAEHALQLLEDGQIDHEEFEDYMTNLGF